MFNIIASFWVIVNNNLNSFYSFVKTYYRRKVYVKLHYFFVIKKTDIYISLFFTFYFNSNL
nr:MAG TPA: hypothetical protein [Caudoviricetes sp.]